MKVRNKDTSNCPICSLSLQPIHSISTINKVYITQHFEHGLAIFEDDGERRYVCIDSQYYLLKLLKESVKYNSCIPHNRKKISKELIQYLDQLDIFDDFIFTTVYMLLVMTPYLFIIYSSYSAFYGNAASK